MAVRARGARERDCQLKSGAAGARVGWGSQRAEGRGPPDPVRIQRLSALTPICPLSSSIRPSHSIMLPKLIRSHSLKAKFPSIAHSSGFRLRNPPPLFAVSAVSPQFLEARSQAGARLGRLIADRPRPASSPYTDISVECYGLQINHLESAFGKLNQVRRPSKDFTVSWIRDCSALARGEGLG